MHQRRGGPATRSRRSLRLEVLQRNGALQYALSPRGEVEKAGRVEARRRNHMARRPKPGVEPNPGVAVVDRAEYAGRPGRKHHAGATRPVDHATVVRQVVEGERIARTTRGGDRRERDPTVGASEQRDAVPPVEP